MGATAVKVMALRASLDPLEAAARQFRLQVESGRLYLSQEALALLLPLLGPLKLERIAPGVLHVRVGSGLFSTVAQIRPAADGEGLLRLDIGGIVGLFLGRVREKLEGKPGFRGVEGNRILIDLAAAVAVSGVELPALKAARAGDGVVELEF